MSLKQRQDKRIILLRQWHRRSVCTGDKKLVREGLQSWPSGHSADLFAGFLYLSLYLHGRLNPHGRTQTSVWRILVVLMPLEVATFCSGFLVVDKFHSLGDIIGGATIGIICALACYRQRFMWNGAALQWSDQSSV